MEFPDDENIHSLQYLFLQGMRPEIKDRGGNHAGSQVGSVEEPVSRREKGSRAPASGHQFHRQAIPFKASYQLLKELHRIAHIISKSFFRQGMPCGIIGCLPHPTRASVNSKECRVFFSYSCSMLSMPGGLSPPQFHLQKVPQSFIHTLLPFSDWLI